MTASFASVDAFNSSASASAASAEQRHAQEWRPETKASQEAMSPIALNLVVLRSSDTERSAAFYTRLGLRFSKHRHGHGPEHFSAALPGSVFEIYPATPEGPSTLGTRIGFRVPSVDAALAALSDYPGAVLTPATDSEWGRRAVLVDPDGHRVEIVES